MRCLPKLVSKQRPVCTLRLPPNEPRPRRQERLVQDLDVSPTGSAAVFCGLVRGEESGIYELAEHGLGALVIRKSREQLVAGQYGARARGRRQVAEDRAHGPFILGTDTIESGLGMLSESSLYAADLAVRLSCQQFPFMVSAVP